MMDNSEAITMQKITSADVRRHLIETGVTFKPSMLDLFARWATEWQMTDVQAVCTRALHRVEYEAAIEEKRRKREIAEGGVGSRNGL